MTILLFQVSAGISRFYCCRRSSWRFCRLFRYSFDRTLSRTCFCMTILLFRVSAGISRFYCCRRSWWRRCRLFRYSFDRTLRRTWNFSITILLCCCRSNRRRPCKILRYSFRRTLRRTCRSCIIIFCSCISWKSNWRRTCRYFSSNNHCYRTLSRPCRTFIFSTSIITMIYLLVVIPIIIVVTISIKCTTNSHD